MSYKHKVQALRDIFPKHRIDTIEGILREMDGNVENATSILLGTDENSPPPPISRQRMRNPKPLMEQPKHIFSTNFLRWPPNVEVMRESIGESPSYSGKIQNAQIPSYKNPIQPVSYSCATNTKNNNAREINPRDDVLNSSAPPRITIDSDLIPGVSYGTDNSTSWWEGFKRRFKGDATNEYHNI